MTAAEWLQALAVVTPVVCAVLVDGMRTRTRIALLEAEQRHDRDDVAELTRRVARHERDPAHARMRPAR